MSYEALTLSVTDGVALITLERPETRNVISDEPLVNELRHACEAMSANDDVRALVLTGSGPAFSAGGNIKQMHERSGMFAGTPRQIAASYRRGIQRLIRTVFAVEVPTIAAVNGHAIGAGLDLALACDIRLAATTAKFGETFVNLGIVPGDGGSWLLPRAVGHQRAAELALTGRVFDAGEALAIGVVLSTHAPEALMEAAIGLGTTIASKPAAAIRFTKQLLRQSSSTLDEVLDATAPVQALLHGSEEHASALAAMMAKHEARALNRPARST